MTDWSRILQQHGPTVWRVAYRLLNNEADAADCFQRTFVAALEFERTQAIGNWGALVSQLATLRALECLRQRRREVSRHAELPADGSPDRRAVDPLQAAQEGELSEHLRRALADLEVREAQVFCLACLEEFSYREIARQLGVTVNHVGVLLNRAQAQLRQRLQAHAPVRNTPDPAQEISHERTQ